MATSNENRLVNIKSQEHNTPWFGNMLRKVL